MEKKTMKIKIACLLVFACFLLQAGISYGADVIKIMPLGDSITVGHGEIQEDAYMSGYRKPLYLALTDLGYHIDFVGSLRYGWLAQPAFDVDNEGHGGYSDDQAASNVYKWVQANPPDFILLHIGTNELDTSPDAVQTILNEIDRYERDYSHPITVLLALIINRAPYSAETTQFNNNVKAMAQARIASGDKIVIVDMESALNYSTDMWDTLHPNEQGYAKMANVWFNALKQILPNSDPHISASPASMDFGSRQVNTPAAQTFTIRNVGGSVLQINTLALDGPGKESFFVENDHCSGQSLPGSGTCQVDIIFSPVVSGTQNASLKISSNDADQPVTTIALGGSGFLASGNNYPSRPRLMSPPSGESITGASVILSWWNSSDPDGDPIHYRVYICPNENFAGCEPIQLGGTSAIGYSWMVMAAGGFAFFGMIWGRRKKALLLLIGVLLAGSSFLVSCGGGGGSGGGDPSTSSSYQVNNLTPGTKYHWKIMAIDSGLLANESEKRNFSTD
jgi:lysophospholipase L1-like esterase